MRAVLLLCLSLAVSNSRQTPNVEPMPHQLKDGDHQKVDKYIVGGVNAQLGQVPFMALLIRLDTFERICGGGIVSSRFILTTAHCVTGIVPTNLAVFFGSVSVNANTSPYAKVERIMRIIIHPAYNSVTNDYDIAILQAANDIQFNPGVMPAAVGIFEPAVGAAVTVAGWGTTSFGGQMSDTLKVVNLNIVSRVSCQISYVVPPITNRMICAYNAGKDTCQYDSGGPLFVGNVTRGLISFGRGCAGIYPSVYTNLGEFITWIQQTTNNAIDIMP